MTTRNFNKLMAAYIKAKKEAEKAKKEADALKNDILAELDRRGVDEFDAGEHVARRTCYESARLDTKTIKAEFPEIYSEYGTITVSVRLTVK